MATQTPPMTAAEQSESIAYLRERGVDAVVSGMAC